MTRKGCVWTRSEERNLWGMCCRTPDRPPMKVARIARILRRPEEAIRARLKRLGWSCGDFRA